jgi:glycosyltransferase involved in cell wall biosynthesis
MKKKRVALLMLGVTNRNVGGAERFFPDFFQRYNEFPEAGYELFYFADAPTLAMLSQLGKLRKGDHVIELVNVSNRFKKPLENFDLLRKIISCGIDLIHVTNYGRNYYDRLLFASKLPAFIRPKIIVNIVDCEVPYVLSDKSSPKHEGYKLRYLPLFNDIRPDGAFTWYELFCTFAREKKLFSDDAVVEAARTRFADTKGFAPAPEKKKIIVWAARLTPQKQPLMFVRAVKYLRENFPEIIAGWSFRIYGNGPQEDAVKNEIRDSKLDTILEHFPTADLRTVFGETSCFVSTQDYENFPSLSMNEAMASGNALIARNVGQTALFLQDGVNGFLAEEDNEKGLALAIRKFLSAPEKHAAMMKASLALCSEVHTPANFIRQIDEFWRRCLAAKK